MDLHDISQNDQITLAARVNSSALFAWLLVRSEALA